LIDDGVASRPNRSALFDLRIKFVGLASGPHTVSKRMVASAFAEDFSAADLAAPSQSNTTISAEPVRTSPAQFQVGQLTETPDGRSYFVSVGQLNGTVDALKLSLVEKGTMLHLTHSSTHGSKTTESHQKFGLPFAFPASDISAEYSHNAGKMTIFLKKPNVVDDNDHVVTTFIVPPQLSTDEAKITIKPEQLPDCIMFKCVPSKYSTEIKLVISGKKLAFHCTHSFDDTDETGEAVVRTIKATQTFTLPWSVAIEQITLVPSEIEPQIKVLKPLPVQVAANPIDIPIKPLA